MVFDGGDYGTGGDQASDEELDFLGRRPAGAGPGPRLAPQAAGEVDRGAEAVPARVVDRADLTPTELATHEQIALLRRELNGLVAAWHHRTGQPHGVIHNDLRRKLGGPAAAHASSTQLKERIGFIRDWASQRRA